MTKFAVTLLLLCLLVATPLQVSARLNAPSEEQDARILKTLHDFEDIDVTSDQLEGAAVGFVLGILAIALCSMLSCCCCGTGRRYRREGCSLCDILACVCLYEICCDDSRGGERSRLLGY